MTSSTANVRVRIPPSPTGNLHVGTARTALFNELFARKHGGQVVLRFEDTDRARSKPEYEQNITEGLKWLGIGYDEGPYWQSQRTDLYTKALTQLLEQGSAYKDGEAIKLKVEPQAIEFTDLVRGTVTTHTDTFGNDFVIARSINDPLYHLAVVVDDELMHITHVIRGEDHISNTAKHILLQRALGYTQPQYAHLPLLLDERRRKLSKRAADTDLLSYRDQGFLPEAMLNYLALLGWNPKTNEEFFTHEELIQRFDLAGVQKAGAIFSLTKLKAINKQYLQKLSAKALREAARPFLEKAGIEVAAPGESYWQAALITEQSRVNTLAELPEAVAFFAPAWGADYPAERLTWKTSTGEETAERLKQMKDKLETLPENEWTAETLQTELMTWIDTGQFGRGEMLWPLRVALTGREHSPGPFEVAGVLGKVETMRRIGIAIDKVSV